MCSQYSYDMVPPTRTMCFLDGRCGCRSKDSSFFHRFSFSVSLLQSLLWSLGSAQTPAGPGSCSTQIKLKDILVSREDTDCLTSCYEGMKT